MHIQQFMPAPKGTVFRGSALLYALLDERVKSPRATLHSGRYLDTLLSTAPESKSRKRSKTAKSPAVVAVKRCTGLATTVRMEQSFYKLHCDFLGKPKVHAFLRDAALNSVLRVRGNTFSKRMRQELEKRAKASLSKGKRKAYRSALRALHKPEVHPRKSVKHVNVPCASAGGVTRVALSKVFCERASAILGKKSFSAWLRAASEAYDLQGIKRRGYRAVYITGFISNLLTDVAPYL